MHFGKKERSLDPATDHEWLELEDFTHRVMDDLFNHLKGIDEEKTWKPIPQETIDRFNEALPASPSSLKTVYRRFMEDILPYPSGNIHPRFWGYVQGTGSPAGVLAEILVAVMNCNVGGRDQIANHVEREVLDWAKEMLGFDAGASGVLTSGCSVADLIALTTARNVKAGYDVNKEGLNNQNGRLIFYTSNQAHSAVRQAIEVLGLGSDALRLVDVDARFKMDSTKLVDHIKQDQKDGHRPACIIATVGSVNTGAIDPLEEIIRIARDFDMWVHVDGAFGVLANLVPEYKEKLAPLKDVDSIAFDFHKWMYMPYDVGCVLIKDEKAHRNSFSHRPDYLAPLQRGLGGGGRWYSEYGVQLSRSFRALKVWFLIKLFGMDHYTQLIEQNIHQARYFAQQVEEEEALELLAPVEMNVVCFRYRVQGMEAEPLNDLNQEILFRLQERGQVAPSSTRIGDCFALRIAVVNHRSKFSDFDLLKKEVLDVAKELTSEN